MLDVTLKKTGRQQMFIINMFSLEATLFPCPRQSTVFANIVFLPGSFAVRSGDHLWFNLGIICGAAQHGSFRLGS